jgi:hypothetical protein
MTLQEKIQDAINVECTYADKNGSSRLSVCDHYNWDRDLWAYRYDIVDAIRNRGYSVSMSVRWGVTDIEVSKQLQLS